MKVKNQLKEQKRVSSQYLNNIDELRVLFIIYIESNSIKTIRKLYTTKKKSIKCWNRESIKRKTKTSIIV